MKAIALTPFCSKKEGDRRITRVCNTHGTNHHWRCLKSYSVLLWEGGVRRITM